METNYSFSEHQMVLKQQEELVNENRNSDRQVLWYGHLILATNSRRTMLRTGEQNGETQRTYRRIQKDNCHDGP